MKQQDSVTWPGYYKLVSGELVEVTKVDTFYKRAYGHLLLSTLPMENRKLSWATTSGKSLGCNPVNDIECPTPRDPRIGEPPPKMKIASASLLFIKVKDVYQLRDGKFAEIIPGDLGNVGYLLPYKRKKYYWHKNGVSRDLPGKYDIINPDPRNEDNNNTEYDLSTIRSWRSSLKFFDNRTRSTKTIFRDPKYPDYVVTLDEAEGRPVYIYNEDIMVYFYRLAMNDNGDRY